MKKLSYLLILASIFFTACSENNTEQATDAKQLKAATLVEVVVAKKKNLTENITTNGNLLANESSDLSAEVGGIVKSIFFEEGSLVKQGDLLLRLNNEDLKAELKRIKTNFELAEKQLKRNKSLYEAKGISEEVLEQSQSNFDALNAQLQKVSAELDKTEVKAPFSGIIGLRNISEGDYLNPGKNFSTLVDIQPIKIEFSFPEKYASNLKIGDSIQFKTPNSSTLKKASIYAINPQVDMGSRSLTARALYANENMDMIPGGFVQVQYQINAFGDAIVLPNQAVIPELDGKKVFKIKNGKVQSQQIESGIRKADQIQILNGISEGDTIVTSGLLQIRDGVPVRLRLDKSYENQLD